MLIKLGVDISRLDRNTRRSLSKVDSLFNSEGEEAVITSTYDGNHGAGSLHYCNQAYDLRLPGNKNKVYARLAEMLVPLGFDVLLEGDHIHIEFDPKT